MDRSVRMPFSFRPMRETHIRRNTEEPRGKLAPELKLRERSENPEEDFLINILRVLRTLNISGVDRQDLLVIPEHKLFERTHISTLRSLDQIQIDHGLSRLR